MPSRALQKCLDLFRVCGGKKAEGYFAKSWFERLGPSDSTCSIGSSRDDQGVKWKWMIYGGGSAHRLAGVVTRGVGPDHKVRLRSRPFERGCFDPRGAHQSFGCFRCFLISWHTHRRLECILLSMVTHPASPLCIVHRQVYPPKLLLEAERESSLSTTCTELLPTSSGMSDSVIHQVRSPRVAIGKSKVVSDQTSVRLVAPLAGAHINRSIGFPWAFITPWPLPSHRARGPFFTSESPPLLL